jgi:hypothetical protein
MGAWIPAETEMMRTKRTKLVHEGKYVAEVDVELLEDPEEWSPHLSLEDAYRLDDVRQALRQGDLETATKHARVFSLTPVAV